MSEQEQTSDDKAEGSSVVVVEKAHHKPFSPTDVEDKPPNPPHRRLRAPVVPSVVEELNLQEESNTSGVESLKERTASKVFLEKLKQNDTKKLSSTKIGQKSEIQIETVSIVPLEIETKRSIMSQPIPAAVSSLPSATASTKLAEPAADDAIDVDVAEEIKDLRVQEAAPTHSDWSDVEEAGGLPRSESRASRLSRAVRQLFCCGVQYEAPSEDNISYHRGYGI